MGTVILTGVGTIGGDAAGVGVTPGAQATRIKNKVATRVIIENVILPIIHPLLLIILDILKQESLQLLSPELIQITLTEEFGGLIHILVG